MENTFVVNNEPVMIKITIEVIPGKKKEDVKEVPVVANPPFVEKVSVHNDNNITI